MNLRTERVGQYGHTHVLHTVLLILYAAELFSSRRARTLFAPKQLAADVTRASGGRSFQMCPMLCQLNGLPRNTHEDQRHDPLH